MTRKKHDKHARLGCSTAERWITCPPSIAASEGIKRKPSSAAAEEGTLAHSVLEAMLLLDYSADDVLNYEMHNGEEIPEDMRYAVAHALNFVHRWETEHPDGRVHVEAEVNPGQYIGRDDNWGTSDLILVDRPALLLDVADYKHGRKKVSAKENKQMRLYGVGALMEHFPKAQWNKVQVTMTVLQPRSKGDFDESETLSGKELLDWMVSVVAPAAEAADDIDGPRTSGDHCFYCPVNGNCRELTMKMFKVAAMEFGEEEQEPPKPPTMAAEEIEWAMRYAPLMARWLDALQDEARRLMLDGIIMAGWKLVYKANHRKWDNSTPAALTKAKLDPDVYMPRDPLAPGALFKQLKRDKVPEKVVKLIEKHVITPAEEVTVAPLSDRRRAVEAEHYGKFKE